jgi:hypothetical protein
MAKINIKGLNAEIAAKGYKVFKPAAEQRIRNALVKETNKLLGDFESHPVTQEIEGGPDAGNKSGTLGGYGNLFSFIGFEAGSDPVSPIRSLLARSIKIKSFRKKRNVLGFVLKFTVPTIEEINSVSPMPWSTESWAEAVERGMSGLGQYLYSDSKSYNVSRSGPAVQLDFDLNGRSKGRSAAIDYMSGILSRMLKSIESNLRRI